MESQKQLPAQGSTNHAGSLLAAVILSSALRFRAIKHWNFWGAWATFVAAIGGRCATPHPAEHRHMNVPANMTL